MYEFVDVHGERVTVRSVRTLSGLLQRGAIVAGTPFRRAGDACFGPAAKHPELRAIAAQSGVVLDDSKGMAAQVPSPAMPWPAPVSLAQPASPNPILPGAMPQRQRTSVPPTGPAASQVRPVSHRLGQAVSVATIMPPRISPWSRPMPPTSRLQPRAATLAGSAAIVLLNLASAAVLGVVARFVVANATGSRPLAMGCMLIATSLAGRYAGRIVATRVPPPPGLAVCLATAVFGIGCYGVAGVSGLIVTVAGVTPFWQCLRQTRR